MPDFVYTLGNRRKLNPMLVTLDGKKLDPYQLIARVCRNSFWRFVQEFWETVPGAGKLKASWHMEYICLEMQSVAERVFKNQPAEYDIVCNISPGTSKSTLCSILFHPWTWTRMPQARHINASHTESLVLDLANKAREVITSEKYQLCFPEIQLAENQGSKGDYANTMGGDRYASTVGGKSPMGRHAHFLIGDDLIDPQKVLSEVERETAKNFIENSLPTRMVDKQVSVICLVMQRLGRGDPTEVMEDLARRGGSRPVRRICLPAELTEKINPPHLAENYVDGLMDPVRMPRSVLEAFRAKSEYYYASQFLQDPMALGGGMFKLDYYNKRVRQAPYDCKRIRYWDRACLVKNTAVWIVRNSVLMCERIQDVIVGDKVMTRSKGQFKNVVWSGMTKYISGVRTVGFKCGGIVSGTDDHPVWVINKGWIHLGCLRVGDRVISCNSRASFNERIDQTPWSEVEVTIFRRFEDPMPVYDLEVEDAHEFFANGILVHNSTQDGGCFTAGVLMGKDKDGSIFVEHVEKGQWEPVERNRRMRAIAMRDRAKYGPKYEPKIYIEAEGGSSGRDAWLGVVRAMQGFNVIEDNVSGMGSKDVRAEQWSSQLAGGNVWIVDNGESTGTGKADWDINSYIQEHCLFKPEPGKRLGRYKDQVDASSRCFALLIGERSAGGLRVYTLGAGKKNVLRIMVCSREDLSMTVVEDHRCLLISLQDPEPLGNGEIPSHALRNLLGSIVLRFADIQPEDYQEVWQEDVLGYNKKPSELIVTRDHGKQLWSFLLRKREPAAEVFVIQDDGDNRGLSAALAISDAMHLQRSSSVFCPAKADTVYGVGDAAPNKHVYETIKISRGMVL